MLLKISLIGHDDSSSVPEHFDCLNPHRICCVCCTDAYGVELPGANPFTQDIKKAAAETLCRVMPTVLRNLRVMVPRQAIDQELLQLLSTFCFKSAVPHLVLTSLFAGKLVLQNSSVLPALFWKMISRI